MDGFADLKHEIVQDLKRVAVDLGHVPSRNEYVAKRLGRYTVDRIIKVFGSWTIALQASGLERDLRKKREKLPDIFAKNILEIVPKQKEFIPDSGIAKSSFTPTLFIGDTHFPFVDQNALCALYEFADRKKPLRIVQLGDLHDMFSQSKFPRSRNNYNCFEEADLAFEMASKMWKTLQKLLPGVECHQMLGNHDARPLKRVLESAPDVEVFVKCGLEPFYTFENVKTLFDSQVELNLGNTFAIHGYLGKLGAHMEYMRENVWCGHSHRGGVVFKKFAERILFEANAGFLGDVNSKALSYRTQKHSHSTLGWGWQDEDGPRFIPL